jgi:uncharacterized protein (TIGR03067 family)
MVYFRDPSGIDYSASRITPPFHLIRRPDWFPFDRRLTAESSLIARGRLEVADRRPVVAHRPYPIVARSRRPTMEDPMSMFVRAALVAMMSLTVYSMANSANLADKPKLEGQHQIIAGERDGKALAEADIKGTTFRFTGDKVVGATKDGTEFLAADYTLDDSKTPCVIVMKLTAGSDKGKELKGLVERTGDTIRIIYAGPGAEAPTEFKTKQNQAMYTLKVEKQ